MRDNIDLLFNFPHIYPRTNIQRDKHFCQQFFSSEFIHFKV